MVGSNAAKDSQELGMRQVFSSGGDGQMTFINLDGMREVVKRCLGCNVVIDLTKVSAETPAEERPVVSTVRNGFFHSKSCEAENARRVSRQIHLRQSVPQQR